MITSNKIKKSAGLFKDREILESGSVSRGAALYPIFNLNDHDLILCFQNYWKWKREVEVVYHLTIRSSNGEVLFNIKNQKVKDINKISIRELSKIGSLNYYDSKNGLVEIEILSEKNIVYPFPAIIGLYKSNNGFVSAVHTCGRTLEKGKEEFRKFSETNFFVGNSRRFIPFVHLFNGEEGSVKNIKVSIFLNSNSKASKVLNIDPLTKPFESRIIFIDINKLLPEDYSRNNIELDDFYLNFDSPAKYLIKIEGECLSIYPRFLCGNLDKKHNHYCVTHTFREVNFKGDNIENCLEDSKKSFVSLPILKDTLKLKAVVYPTASPTPMKVLMQTRSLDNLKVVTSSQIRDLTLNSCEIFTTNISSNDYPGLVATALPSNNENCLPARIAINMMYFLQSGMNTMAPDIAHQMSSYLTGYKKNYWYSGVFFEGYKNIILGSSITSESLNKYTTESIEFKLSVGLENINMVFEKNFSFDPQLSKSFSININEFIEKNEVGIKKDTSFYWKINMINGNMGALYCLAYNEKKGCVYGEHSF